jgi:hypothetical protein
MSTGAIIFCIFMAFWFGFLLGGRTAFRIADELNKPVWVSSPGNPNE